MGKKNALRSEIFIHTFEIQSKGHLLTYLKIDIVDLI